MADPQAKKLPIDEYNVDAVVRRAESRLKKMGWIESDVDGYRGYRLHIERSKFLPLIEEIVREAYACGAVFHDNSLDKI